MSTRATRLSVFRIVHSSCLDKRVLQVLVEADYIDAHQSWCIHGFPSSPTIAVTSFEVATFVKSFILFDTINEFN